MAGRGAVDRQDGMADQSKISTTGTVSTSGARAWQGNADRPAADRPAVGVRAAGAAGADGDSRHCQGVMAYLKNLADELAAIGLVARVIRMRSGVAFVRVVNPVATAMRENVTCAPSPCGLHDWYYWWSWGECMHDVGDPAGAASKVAHVLDTVAAPTG
jgi:hypothetical protein